MDQDALLPPDRSAVEETHGPHSYASATEIAGASKLGAVTTSADRERTGVFTSLVKEDGDIAGLVAYSIYKQNKLDWLQAFEVAKSRVPDEAELASYIIGESTPRRLATYRHLAEATLAGHGPDIEGRVPVRSAFGSGQKARSGSGGVTTAMMLIYGAIAVLVVIGFWFAAHYAGTTH